jgi:EAL domain-containing protein (putative c-di-GMP-specific phosphodiesterase class I)/F0F1-type ATP synthase membrane subunit c/vacuolar-type H+-ATPase subunit K
MASDLRHCGYKAADVARIYGFNLVLTPVNLAGVGNSIVQGLTGDKSVFGRTPKVRNRTVPNLLFIVAPYLIVALAVYTLLVDYDHKKWDDFVYAVLNSLLTMYAIFAFIGLRHSIADTFVQLKARLYRVEQTDHGPVRDPAAIVADPAVADWASVLYFGSTGASSLIGTVPMQAPSGRSAPVTLTRPAHDAFAELRAIEGAPLGIDGATAISADVSFRTVFQPIVALHGGRTAGYEALTRFADGVGPERWLADASARGDGVELETMLTRAAVLGSRKLPDDAFIGLNISGEFARAGSALRSIVESTNRSLVLEIDRRIVTDPAISQVLAELPRRVRLGITGANPSYDSLALVRELRPGVVKLERDWVRQVHLDAARQMLIRALVSMADESGCMLVAEGIETTAELDALRDLGVGFGQGYLLGRPKELVVS